MIDHKTVCVEASEVHQMEQMDKLGMNVIPVPFRDAYAFGGGLHCATADVYREGTCEDSDFRLGLGRYSLRGSLHRSLRRLL